MLCTGRTCLLSLALLRDHTSTFLRTPKYGAFHACTNAAPFGMTPKTVWPTGSWTKSEPWWRYLALLMVGASNRLASRLGQMTEWNPRGSARMMSGTPRGPDKPPSLMEFPPVAWPSMVKTLRNWVLSNFIIRPYLDRHFNHKDFLLGAKQALVTISSHLSRGHFSAIEGLVSNEAVEEIQRNYNLLSMKQCQDLAVKLDDIYFCFLYQIGIIMDNRTDQRFAEITVVYHCLPGLEEMREQDPLFQAMEKYKDHITVCNYRFIREYTKGIDSDWTVNKLNHFKPVYFE